LFALLVCIIISQNVIGMSVMHDLSVFLFPMIVVSQMWTFSIVKPILIFVLVGLLEAMTKSDGIL
jgi:hypothetical protein